MLLTQRELLRVAGIPPQVVPAGDEDA